MFRCFAAMIIAATVALLNSAVVAQELPASSQQVVVALAEIETEGGTIDIEKSDGQEVSSLKASRENVKDEQVKALKFHDLKNLQAALNETAKLKDVQRIGINFCWIGPRTLSAAELQKIAAIESLEELNLTDTTIDSKELKQLAKLPNLKRLSFGELTSRAFTDAHLEGLAPLASVTTVDISKVRKISPEAVAAFQKKRPDCVVITAKVVK